jgi:hypothetical protein
MTPSAKKKWLVKEGGQRGGESNAGIHKICLNFKNFDKFWTNLELRLTNLGRYLPIFRPVFPVFPKTGFLATYRYFFRNEKKNLGKHTSTLLPRAS